MREWKVRMNTDKTHQNNAVVERVVNEIEWFEMKHHVLAQKVETDESYFLWKYIYHISAPISIFGQLDVFTADFLRKLHESPSTVVAFDAGLEKSLLFPHKNMRSDHEYSPVKWVDS